MRYAWLLLMLLLTLLAGCAQATTHEGHMADGADPMAAGTVLDPPTQLVDFTLPSSLGRPMGLADLKGKPTLLFFGFTNCPDYCPTTLADFKRTKADLGADGDKVNYLLISVDPERDTPDVLASYVSGFDPSFVGLQGDDATLRKIGRDFGLFYERQPPDSSGAYDVDHSSAVYLLDTEGGLRVLYSDGTPYTTYVQDLRRMIADSR